MGSDTKDRVRDANEVPHEVQITDSFEIQKTELTQLQWYFVMGYNPSEFSRRENCPAGHLVLNGVELCADHPVEMISWFDAQAFIRRLNDSRDGFIYRMPTEAEWEFAARGGLEGAEFAWGDELTPGGRHMANTWQGAFPHENTREDGYARTSPVRTYPANGYGLYDMIGNVWEWTTDWYSSKHPADAAKACCVPENPRGGPAEASYDPRQPQVRIPRKVLKGGSHLCAPSYCRRYRPAARHAEAVDTTTSHVSFRCIVRDAAGA